VGGERAAHRPRTQRLDSGRTAGDATSRFYRPCDEVTQGARLPDIVRNSIASVVSRVTRVRIHFVGGGIRTPRGFKNRLLPAISVPGGFRWRTHQLHNPVV